MSPPVSETERQLTLEEEAALFQKAERSIIRIEQQERYVDAMRDRHLRRWLAGDPIDPLSEPDLVNWFVLMGDLSSRGVAITRVRILNDPPTDDQNWMRWLGQWNTAAGEEMRYISRSQALDCGLLPGAGNDDWWLFDEHTLLTLRFDDAGGFQTAMDTTHQPTVQGALDYWPVAVANSTALPSDIVLPDRDQLSSLG